MNSQGGFLGLKKNLGCWVCLIALGALAAIIVPRVLRTRASARYTICKSSLHDVGNALERYAEDHDDELPSNLEQLVPDYLRRIPKCPLINERTYTLTVGPNAPHNKNQNPKFFLLECMGDQHTASDHPPDYPKYGRGLGPIDP